MRTRIVLTNGKISRELFWLTHNGKDIYWGFGGAKLRHKISHHASGIKYLCANDKIIRRDIVSPPNKVKGYEPIITFGSIYNPSYYDDSQTISFSGSKLDAVFMVDTRSLPKKGHNNIDVGIIEAGRLDVVQNILRTGTHLPEDTTSNFKILQILLITNCIPWIFIKVDNFILKNV